MEIDWKGITHSALAITDGKQKSKIIALVTPMQVDEELLTSLVPSEDDGFPAVGRWFTGPGEGWLLAFKTSDPARRHVDALAHSLEQAGITGTLTGVKGYRPPRRLKRLCVGGRWQALFMYQPQPGRSGEPGWRGDPDLFGRIADHLVDWAAEDAGQLVLDFGEVPDLPYQHEAGRKEIRERAETEVSTFAKSYHQERSRVRHVQITSPTYVVMAQETARAEGFVDAGQLIDSMMSAPLDQLSFAMLTDCDLYLTMASPSVHFNGKDYFHHPEIWDEYVLDPCGVQILTEKHLERAHNLDDWNTTRLNDRLFVVAAKDLAPWYDRQPMVFPREILHKFEAKARADFGDMLFTHATAQRLGIETKPGRAEP
ncbi:MAG: hypothetical protein CVT62_09395 [Actinobacteria bacterium HGW-Actinobacteria-2]|nr:MAG: hypothetical protein CVT62_09395 [Actinobacteria bacterium HGW-Actinobacteria-2]